MIAMKHAYAPAVESDGDRVLAERLWTRGESEDIAKRGAWEKEGAPSTDLRH